MINWVAGVHEPKSLLFSSQWKFFSLVDLLTFEKKIYLIPVVYRARTFFFNEFAIWRSLTIHVFFFMKFHFLKGKIRVGVEGGKG